MNSPENKVIRRIILGISEMTDPGLRQTIEMLIFVSRRTASA